MIAFLGMGLMGTAFVQAMRARGEDVRVWNRTRSKADALSEVGATVADTAGDAVRGASRVHITLLDDAAVDSVLDSIVDALDADAIVIDHSTTAPAPTAERAERMRARGVRFIHVPMFMAPQNAREGTGVMLAAGPAELFEEVRPVLERMTGKLRYLGERPDLAAAYKLFGNMSMIFCVTGVADVLALARGLDIEPLDAVSLYDDFQPGGQFQIRGRRMAMEDFAPTFELTAARKDLRLMLETAERNDVTLRVLPAIAKRIDEVLAAGRGSDDLSVVGAPDV